MYIQVLEEHLLASRQHLFGGRPCIFQEDNVKPIPASVTTAWLRNRRVRVLNWPACSPDLSPVKNIRWNMKLKIWQRPRTIGSKNPVSDTKGTTVLSHNSSNWSPQYPDIYRLLLKEEGQLHSGTMGLSQLWDLLLPSNSKLLYLLGPTLSYS